MPPSNDFKTKTEIDKHIRRLETKIDKAKKKSESEGWEATDKGSLKLGAGCMVTSDFTEYSVEEKVMAQQQFNEYKDVEEGAIHHKATLDKKLEKWEKELEELRDLRDNWTGPD